MGLSRELVGKQPSGEMFRLKRMLRQFANNIMIPTIRENYHERPNILSNRPRRPAGADPAKGEKRMFKLKAKARDLFRALYTLKRCHGNIKMKEMK
jgi:hypothetical protein